MEEDSRKQQVGAVGMHRDRVVVVGGVGCMAGSNKKIAAGDDGVVVANGELDG